MPKKTEKRSVIIIFDFYIFALSIKIIYVQKRTSYATNIALLNLQKYTGKQDIYTLWTNNEAYFTACEAS